MCFIVFSAQKNIFTLLNQFVMHEEIVHFVWKHSPSLFNGILLDDVETLEVISPGVHNSDSGPDFFNAKLRIGQTIWAGNIEIHINASDWNKHKHNTDPAFDSVILHLVVNYDKEVHNSQGKKVLTVQVPYPDNLEWELQRLVGQDSWIPCAQSLPSYNGLQLQMWLSSLAAERLEQKTEQIKALVNHFSGSWEEAFYVSMARSFGLKINALPFELLAKATPLKYLAKIRDCLFSIEAMLFGQAGILPSDEKADDYTQRLVKEYSYHKAKFSLSPIPNHLWKFMRLRPMAFPTIRIAQFAMLIHSSSALFSKCLEATNLKQLHGLLKVKTSEYWHSHYTFGNETSYRKKSIGLATIDIIILNTIIPFAFAYGIERGNDALKEKALALLEQMKPEKNSMTEGFLKLGVSASNAYTTQALAQLKNEYCDKRKCLYCQVGANVLLKRV